MLACTGTQVCEVALIRRRQANRRRQDKVFGHNFILQTQIGRFQIFQGKKPQQRIPDDFQAGEQPMQSELGMLSPDAH